MKPQSYLVLYRDAPGQQTLFFGPFVSESVARFFKAEMPEPLDGGFCRIATLQPYTVHEGHVVHDNILSVRRAREAVPAAT